MNILWFNPSKHLSTLLLKLYPGGYALTPMCASSMFCCSCGIISKGWSTFYINIKHTEWWYIKHGQQFQYSETNGRNLHMHMWSMCTKLRFQISVKKISWSGSGVINVNVGRCLIHQGMNISFIFWGWLITSSKFAPVVPPPMGTKTRQPQPRANEEVPTGTSTDPLGAPLHFRLYQKVMVPPHTWRQIEVPHPLNKWQPHLLTLAGVDQLPWNQTLWCHRDIWLASV